MTRRELAKLAAAGAALLPQEATPADAKYTGPLGGFEDKVNRADFDPVVFTRALHDAAPLRLAFQGRNRREAEEWQKALRPKITELIGGFPTGGRRSSPDPRGPRIPRLPPREVRLPEPAGLVRAGLSADAEGRQGRRSADDLPARPRPRRRRYRRHRREGPATAPTRPATSTIRDAGRRARHGGRGHRADGVRLPARARD